MNARVVLRQVAPADLAERAVLAAVLAIAALASYIHIRAVWQHTAAPVPDLGPLLVDGLFAAAWLRMRRRRRQGAPVGWLAWVALGLALAATVAGNLAAAVIAGHRDALALVVAAWPAIAFALVWELVTGHGRAPASDAGEPGGTLAPTRDWLLAGMNASVSAASDPPAPASDAGEPGETLADTRDRLLAEGVGRGRLAAALGITAWEARQLIEAYAREKEAAG